MSDLRCSVIIPSHNRRDLLAQVLEGFERQTISGDLFEVIVVLDNSTDASEELLRYWQRSGRLKNLRWYNQPKMGPANARNRGANMAGAPIIIFLDDDIVPGPDFLESHLRWYKDDEPIAVLGDCPMAAGDDSLHAILVKAWWDEMYYIRALPGHQANFRDFCSGNVSLRKKDYIAVGGFDTRFHGYGGEDYELGYRLIKAGVHLVIDAAIQAVHYHRNTFTGAFRNTFQEASGDILIGQKHPELIPYMRIYSINGGSWDFFARLAMDHPVLGDSLAAIMGYSLSIFERLRFRGIVFNWFGWLRYYAYWRGVRASLGSWDGWRAFNELAIPSTPQYLDISDGVPEDLTVICTDHPGPTQIMFCGHSMGGLYLSSQAELPIRQYVAEQIINNFGTRLWLELIRPIAPGRARRPRQVDIGKGLTGYIQFTNGCI